MLSGCLAQQILEAGMLILGPILFGSFEVPQSITLGGRQRLAVHQLPGGGRVVDAMGGDDGELGWSGILSGPEASGRARALDRLRRGGLPWPLAWDGWRFTVIVSRFEADSADPHWMPYRLSSVVVAEGDVAAPELLPLAPTLAEAVVLGAGPGLEDRLAQAGAGLAGPDLEGVLAAAGQAARLAVARAFSGALGAA